MRTRRQPAFIRTPIALALGLTLWVPAAQADFSGTYAPANWTFDGGAGDGNVNTSSAPSSVTLTGNNNGANGVYTNYTVALQGCGISCDVSFDWNYSTSDGPFYDPAGYIINNANTQLTLSSGGNSQSGSVNLSSLNTGDIVGWYVYSTDGIFGTGQITISNLEILGSLGAFDSAVAQANTPGYGSALVIDANNNLLALFSGLSSEQEVSNAVSQTLPVFAGAGSLAARNALSGINGAVSDRQGANLGLSSGDVMLSDQHFWIQPFGTWTKQGERKGVSGFDADTGGLVLGLDSLINSQTRLGVAFAYANTNVEGNSTTAPQSLLIDTYQLVGYGSRALNDSTDLTFQADVGRNRNQGQRVIAFTSSVAEADYDSYSAHLGTGIARTYAINDANRVVATATADYTWIKDESYTESGAGILNLDVESDTTEAFVAGVEGQLIHTLNPTTELNGKLGLGYDLINDQAGITSSFAGAPSAQFTTKGLDPSPWIATAGFGLSHTADTGAEISANYDAAYRSDYLSQTASLKLRLPF